MAPAVMVKKKEQWRKADLATVETNLAEKNNEERLIGKQVSTLSNEELFVVDKTGSASLRSRIGKKILRVDEILASKSSFIPAVSHSKKKAFKGLKISKKIKSDSSVDKCKEKTSLEIMVDPKESVLDQWESTDPSIIKNLKRKQTRFICSINSFPSIKNGSQGESYNPEFFSHQKLLKEATEIEVKKLEQSKIEHSLKRQSTVDEMEVKAAHDLELLLSGKMQKLEEETTNIEIKVAVPKRKTKAQRNREARANAQRMAALAKKDSNRAINLLKLQLKLLKHEKGEDYNQKLAELKKKKMEIIAKKVKRLGKHKFKPPSQPITLSDELPQSLRELKPEGSLFTDRFASLQERNIIESRIPLGKQRKYPIKLYEKHSYKRFK